MADCFRGKEFKHRCFASKQVDREQCDLQETILQLKTCPERTMRVERHLSQSLILWRDIRLSVLKRTDGKMVQEKRSERVRSQADKEKFSHWRALKFRAQRFNWGCEEHLKKGECGSSGSRTAACRQKTKNLQTQGRRIFKLQHGQSPRRGLWEHLLEKSRVGLWKL